MKSPRPKAPKSPPKYAPKYAKPTEEPGTTGHSWDGIREYDNPLPRWWLWIFYATIIWSVIYMVVYPSWPLLKEATPGLLGYSSRAEYNETIKEYAAVTAPLDARLVATDLTEIHTDPELAQYANSGGAAVFRTYCSQCHGSGAAGSKGYPNLLDDDWLWGGSFDEIYHTVRYGVRSDFDDARYSEMPAFGDLLESHELDQVKHYVMSLSGSVYNAALAPAGQQVFQDNCADCHGENGQGNREFGAPNLTDKVWLYDQDQSGVLAIITNSRFGIMPGWQDKLTEAELRQVTYYVHQLGGGE